MSAKYSSRCRSSSRRNCVSSFTCIHRTGLLLISSPRRTRQDKSHSLSDSKSNEEVSSSFPVTLIWRSGRGSVEIFYHSFDIQSLTPSRKIKQPRQDEFCEPDMPAVVRLPYISIVGSEVLQVIESQVLVCMLRARRRKRRQITIGKDREVKLIPA